MKLSQIIMPLALAAKAMAHGEEAEEAGYVAPVQFTEDGLSNVLKVSSKDPTADAPAAIGQFVAFLQRNPKIKQSAEKVIKDPKNQEAVAEGKQLVQEILSSSKGSQINIYEAKIEVLDFVYDHPKFFQLIQSVAMSVIKENPTLLDDFFTTLGRLVKANPELFVMLRQSIMDFSHDNEEAYQKGFELLLKASLTNVEFSSYALIHILKLDKIACGLTSGAAGGSASECACDEPHESTYQVEEAPPAEEPTPVGEGELVPNEPVYTPDAPVSEGDLTPNEPAYPEGEIEGEPPTSSYETEPAPVSEGELSPKEPVYTPEPAPVSEGDLTPNQPAYTPDAPREPAPVSEGEQAPPTSSYETGPAPVSEGETEEDCDEEEGMGEEEECDEEDMPVPNAPAYDGEVPETPAPATPETPATATPAPEVPVPNAPAYDGEAPETPATAPEVPSEGDVQEPTPEIEESVPETPATATPAPEVPSEGDVKEPTPEIEESVPETPTPAPKVEEPVEPTPEETYDETTPEEEEEEGDEDVPTTSEGSIDEPTENTSSYNSETPEEPKTETPAPVETPKPTTPVSSGQVEEPKDVYQVKAPAASTSEPVDEEVKEESEIDEPEVEEEVEEPTSEGSVEEEVEIEEEEPIETPVAVPEEIQEPTPETYKRPEYPTTAAPPTSEGSVVEEEKVPEVIEDKSQTYASTKAPKIPAYTI